MYNFLVEGTMSSGKDYSRREFMTKPLVYLASAGVLSASTKLRGAETVPAENAPNPGKVIQRRLGRTGITLPVVSMGAMNADIPGLLLRAYELGVRHFDTAAVYQGGRNEEMVGKVVKQLGVRDKVVIGTKVLIFPPMFKDPSPEAAKAQFLKVAESSLQRLQTDYVDILCLHTPNSLAEMNHPGIQDAMTLLKNQGKARYLGFSTHSAQADMLKAAAESGFYDVVVMAFNYTMSENRAVLEAMKLAVSKGIGLIAMKTQVGGTPQTGAFYREKLLQKDVKPPVNHTAVLKWALQHEAITTAIPGVTDFAHLEEDFSVASNLELTPEEKKYLADKDLKARLEFCQQCGECVASCPRKVDIPTLMRTHMYALQYGNTYQAKATLAEMPKENGLEVCRSCTACRAACVNTVNIARKIRALKTIQFA